MDSHKLYLIATLGYPGSGKTHFTEQFKNHIHAVHLNSDRIRLEMTDSPTYEPWEHKQVFSLMDYFTEELLNIGTSVIYDGNITRRMYRDNIRRLSNHYNATYLLIVFNVPVEVALARIKNREQQVSGIRKKYYRNIPEEALFRIKENIEAPDDDEPHVIISGTDTYENQFEIVMRAFQR